ncbi:MAG: DUF5011 domain-containing protein [Cytophagia bacterium]|nr:DUF5011 domain-containing protein [Cytophagia bacterium]
MTNLMKGIKKLCLLLVMFILPVSLINAQSVFPILPGSSLSDSDDDQVLRTWLEEVGVVPSGTLLYRRSTDGASSTAFHNKVDNEGPTLVLIKANNGTVFGGFSMASWSSVGSGYVGSNEAFLFNLTTNKKAEPYYPQYSIYTNPNYGPTFGNHSIYINNTMDGGYIGTHGYYSVDGSGYQTTTQINALSGINTTVTGSYSFGSGFITEIEVFKVEFNSSGPDIQGQDITVQLDQNGSVTITPEDIDNGSSDPDGAVTLSIDINTFDCSNLGGNSSAITPELVGTITQNSYSLGASYDPVREEFLYPQWSSNTVYRFDQDRNSLGSFTMPHSSILDMWVDANGDYYTVDYNGQRIRKINAENLSVIWNVGITGEGSYGARAITTDDQFVYYHRYNSTKIIKLDKADGSYQGFIQLPAGSSTYHDFRSMVYANGKIYIGGYVRFGNLQNNWASIHIIDAATGAYQSSFTTQYQTDYGLAFDGEVIWTHYYNSISTGYKVSEGNAYGNGSGGSNNSVTLTATDPLGNSSSKVFGVTVEDNISPTIALNGGAQMTVDSDTQFNDPGAAASDNCSAEVEMDDSELDLSTPGVYTIYYKAVDQSGNESATITREVTVVDATPPVVRAGRIIVELDENGTASVDPASLDNGSTDNSGGNLTFTLDQTTFTCDDLVTGPISVAVGPTYTGTTQNRPTDHGSGYNPHTGGFYHVPWSGSTVNEYDADGNLVQSFDAGVSQIMQIWQDLQSTDYYTANWGNNFVTRRSGSTEVWRYNLGARAAAITTDEDYLYALGSGRNFFTVIDKETGSLVRNINLGGALDANGVFAYANGKLYLGGYASNWTNISGTWNAIHVFDAATGNYEQSVSTNVQNYSLAFDGEIMWISNRNNIVYGYQISDGNAYGSGGVAVTLTATDALGNFSTAEGTVVVVDLLAPTVALNGGESIATPVGQAFADPGATALDNCLASVEVTGTVDANTLGSYTLTYKAIDGSGNESAEVTRTVNVIPASIDLVATSPASGETGVGVTTNTISLAFSEDIVFGSGQILFTNLNSNEIQTFNVGDTNLSINGSVLTISLENPLQYGASYAIQMNAGFVESSAYGISFDGINDNTTFTFQSEGDAIEPTVVTQDITVELDANGNATITPQDVDNGSSDNSGNLTLSLDRTDFNCDDLLGNSLNFDGVNDNVRLSTPLAIGQGSTTVEVWVKVPEVGQGGLLANERPGIILGNYDSPNSISYEVYSAGRLRVWWNAGQAGAVGTRDLRDGEWHHIAFVRIANENRFIGYIDGVEEFNVVMNSSDVTFNSLHKIGSDNRSGTKQNFHGNIDELRIWNYARTQSEIEAEMFDPLKGIENGLINYWNFEERSGSTLNDLVAGNNGTLLQMDVVNDWEDGAPTNTIPVKLTGTDASNNSSFAIALVTVVDNIAPTVNLNGNATITLNQNETYTETATAEDNCSATLEITGTVDTATAGTYTLTYKATDGSGNESAEVTRTVTVLDITDPILTVADINVITDAGTCGATIADFGASATDNSGVVTITYDIAEGALFTVGTTQVTATATDASNNTVSATFDVTVTDNEAPIITLNGDATVYHDAFTPYTDLGATADDNCSTTLSTTDNVNVNVLGTYTVTYTATDGSGNETMETRTVIVQDATDPVAIAQDITVQLDANGNATITPEDIDNGSSDDSNNVTLSLDITDFDCDDVGQASSATPVTYVGNVTMQTYGHGAGFNPNTNEFWYPQFGSGVVYRYDLDNNLLGSFATGQTQIMQIWIDTDSETDWYSADRGESTVTRRNASGVVWSYSLQAAAAVSTDANYVYAQGEYLDYVVVLDKSTGAFVRNIQLPGGMKSFGGLVIANGYMYFSGDAMGGWSNYGGYAVIHQLDLDGNYIGSTGTNDRVYNLAFDGENVWISKNSATVYGYKISDGNSFGAGGAGIGVTLTVTDASGNTASAIANVTVIDEIAPEITAPSDVSVVATSAAGAVVNYTTPVGTDNCSVTTELTAGFASGETFPIGTTVVTYTATDGSGNATSASFNVEVSGLAPEIIVPTNIILNNDAGVCGAVVNFEATETTAIPPSTITYDIQPGTLFAVGTTTVTAIATNAVGTSTKTFTVSIIDTEVPVITLNGDATVYHDAFTPYTDLGATADDNCSATLVTTDDVDVNTLGSYNVTYTATDAAGNETVETRTVIVQDATDPVAIAQDITVQLDANGNASISPEDLDNGSTDDSGNVTLSIDQSTFDCSNIDAESCSSYSLSFDGNREMVVVGNQPHLNFSSDNTYTIEAWVKAAPENGSAYPQIYQKSDALTYFGYGLQIEPSGKPQLYMIAQSGSVWINGEFNLYDNEWHHVAVSYDGSGNTNGIVFHVDGNQVNSSIASSNFNGGDFSNEGKATIGGYDPDGNDAYDFIGNIDEVRVWNVIRSSSEISSSYTSCLSSNEEGLVGYFKLEAGAGTTVTDASSYNVTSSLLNMEEEDWSTDISSELPSGVGNQVTLTVTDPSGNTASAIANVTVEDNVLPNVLTQDITMNLDANGSATITADQIDYGSSDNCAVESIELDITSFTCDDLGANTVTLTVTDVNGNLATGTATVTVLDITPPTVITKDITVSLDANGNASIIPSDVDNGSDDNCGIQSLLFGVSGDNGGQEVVPVISGTRSGRELTGISYTYGGETKTLTPADAIGSTLILSTLTAGPSAANRFWDANFNTGMTEEKALGVLGDLDLGTVLQDCSDPVGVQHDVMFDTPITPGAGPEIFIVHGSLTQDIKILDTNGDVVKTINVNINNSSSLVTIGGSAYATRFYGFYLRDNVNFRVDQYGTHGSTQNRVLALDINASEVPEIGGIRFGGGGGCNYIYEILGFQPEVATAPQLDFSCDDLGANTVTLQATDGSGNVSIETATVTIVDDILPVITLNGDAIVQHEAYSPYTDEGAVATDNCSPTLITDNPVDVNNPGTYTVTYTATDESGNETTANRTVQIVDTTDPTVITQDVTVYLDASGNASITPEQVDNGSSDASGQVSLSLDVSEFDCADLGGGSAALDINGVNRGALIQNFSAPGVFTLEAWIFNRSNASGWRTLLEFDNDAPYFGLENGGYLTLYSSGARNPQQLPVNEWIHVAVSYQPGSTHLYLNGQLVATGSGNINTTGNSLGIGYNQGDNPFTGIIDDVKVWNTIRTQQEIEASMNGTVSSQHTDLIGYWDLNEGSGNTLEDVSGNGNNGSLNDTSAWSEGNTETGLNEVTLTVTDLNGNSATGTAIVTVLDEIAPTVVGKPIEVTLTASGTVSITPQDVLDSGFDNCGPVTYTVSQDTFGATEALNSPVTIQLTGTDPSGNANTVDVLVTVIDPVPTVITQDITVYLDASGSVTIAPEDVDDGSSSVVGLSGLSLDITVFGCENVGENTVTLTATSTLGSSASGEAIVTVLDAILPTVLTQNLIVDLSNGGVSITPVQVNNGSFDNCDIQSIILDKEFFTCEDLGDNIVTLTVTDVNGNINTAMATVTVRDVTAPTAQAKNRTYGLDENGRLSITATDIDNFSFDECGGPVTISIDKTDFDCSNVGDNVITLTVVDASGNTNTATSILTIQDAMEPVVVAKEIITVYLDENGQVSITPADVDNGSYDNCGIDRLEIDKSNFNCDDIGDHVVTLRAYDVNGNMDVNRGQTIVQVRDNIATTVLTQNIIVDLDENGYASITPDMVDAGTFDNCSFVLSLSRSEFSCGDVGDNVVKLIATSNSGLSGAVEEKEAIVTVRDVTAAQVITQDITVELDVNGNASITTGMIDNGSNDACGIASYALNQYDFDCSNVGANTVTLTVTDNNGNISTGTATVTVEDKIAAEVITQNITVQLDATGNASITTGMIDNGSNDACGIASYALNQYDFDCSNVGANTVTLTVTDNNGNISTGTATVTVEDKIAAEVITQDITVELDENGSATITTSDIDNGSNDACGIASYALDNNSFSCADTGANTVTLTVTDVNGNVSSATATVTVIDVIAPTVITQDITIQLDENGEASITTSSVDNGSFDNCSFTLSLDNTSFTCDNVGANTVTLTATDASGNETSATATVTVEDSILPTVVPQNIEVYLDEAGNTSITVSDVDGGTYDNCGVASITIDIDSFDCSDLGDNNVTLTATDVNGNVNTGVAVVTVIDNIAPTVGVQGITVTLDENGTASITPEDVLLFSEDDLRRDTECEVTDGEDFGMFLKKYLPGEGSDLATGVNNENSLDNNGASGANLWGNWGSFWKGKGRGDDDDRGKGEGRDKAKPKDARFTFTTAGTITKSLAGTASVTGTLQSTEDATDQWVVTLNLGQGYSWEEWKAMGNTFKGEWWEVKDLYKDWTYYNLQSGSLTGVGRNAGETVSLSNGHEKFGFQSGIGANLVNGNNGMAGWFEYENRKGDEEKGHFTFDIDNCGLVAVPEGTVYTSDNCTIVSYSFDKDSFDCNDYPTTTVNLTATDQSGNSTTVPVEVTVEDNIAPTAIALDYITVSLGADGTVTIDPSQVDGGSYDNTACITLSLDQTTFDCEDVGRGSSFYVYSEEESCKGHKHTHGKGHNYDDDDESNDPGRGRAYGHKKTRKTRLKGHRVTLTITDAAGNTDQVESYVVVEDQLAPEIAAGPVTLVVYNETSTYYKKERVRDGKKWKWEYVEYTKVDEKYEYLKDEDIEPLVTDNCGVYKVYFDKQKYGVEDAGINQLQVTARDYNGNMSTGMVSINVIDITGLGEYVDMCYNGETKQVKQDKVQDYLRKGAVLGSCNLNMGASDFGLGEPAKPEGEELFIPELTLESYPNPTAGMTYMKISSNISGPARLALMSTSGVEMDELYKGDLEANTEIEVGYDAAHLPSGVYIVRLVTAGQVRNLKLMVKK